MIKNLLAQVSLTDIEKNTSGSNFAGKGIGYLVSEIIKYALPIAGIALLFLLISGGLQFMTSGGDPKSMEAARHRITNALVGFIIVFAAYWIVQIVGNILGLEVFGSIFQ